MTDKEKNEIQKDIVAVLPKNPHGRLLLAPRVGKSKIIINLIKRDKPESILWVTPSAKLADEDIPSEFGKWGAKRFLKRLTTCTWMSLNKITGHFDWIILDEDQFITENNVENLLDNSLTRKSIISMSGTPTKHDDKKQLFARLSLKSLYDISINDAVDMGLLANYSIKVIMVPMTNEKIIESGTKVKRFMQSEIANYDYLTKEMKRAMFQRRKDVQFRILNRRRAILDSPSKFKALEHLFSNLEGRKLMFCPGIKQAEKLCSYTYHSETDNKDINKFISGEINEIALVNTGGTGWTYKEIDHLIIGQADSDKNGLTSQKISRTLLNQGDYEATIWIVCLKNTQDEQWVKSTLESFDKNKVQYLDYKPITGTFVAQEPVLNINKL